MVLIPGQGGGRERPAGHCRPWPGRSTCLTPRPRRACVPRKRSSAIGPISIGFRKPFPASAGIASDNRDEIERARHALTLAAQAGQVALVSGAILAYSLWRRRFLKPSRAGPRFGANSIIRVEPGMTAMLAAAAAVGAPLGEDFCAVSLSDNLKSWDIIERRLAPRREPGFRHRTL